MPNPNLRSPPPDALIPNSPPVTPSLFIPSTVLPQCSLSGRIRMVYGRLFPPPVPHTSSATASPAATLETGLTRREHEIPRITFHIHTKLPPYTFQQEGGTSDYLPPALLQAPGKKGKAKLVVYDIKVTLFHPSWPEAASASLSSETKVEANAIEEQILRNLGEDRKELEKLLMSTTSVAMDCEGIKVLGVRHVPTEGRVEVQLQSKGERRVRRLAAGAAGAAGAGAQGGSDEILRLCKPIDFVSDLLDADTIFGSTPAWLSSAPNFSSTSGSTGQPSAPTAAAPSAPTAALTPQPYNLQARVVVSVDRPAQPQDAHTASASPATPVAPPLVGPGPGVLPASSGAAAGSSRLRPITSHPVPLFPQQQHLSSTAALALGRPDSSITSATSGSKSTSTLTPLSSDDTEMTTVERSASRSPVKGHVPVLAHTSMTRTKTGISTSMDVDEPMIDIGLDLDDTEGTNEVDKVPPPKRPRTSVEQSRTASRQPSLSSSNTPRPKLEPRSEEESRNIVRLGPPPRISSGDVFSAPTPAPTYARVHAHPVTPQYPTRPLRPMSRNSSGISEGASAASSPAVHRQTPSSSTRRISFPSRTPSRGMERMESMDIAASSPTFAPGRRASEKDILRVRRREAEVLAGQRAQAELAESSRAAEQRSREVHTLRQATNISGIPYTPLGQVRSGTHANVIGVVVNVAGLKRIHTGDWKIDIILADPTRHAANTDGDGSNDEFVVTIFRPQLDQLPREDTLNIGTAILFRNIAIKVFNEKTKGQAFTPKMEAENTWAILLPGGQDTANGQSTTNGQHEHQDRGKVILANPRDMYPPLSKGEVERMIAVRQWYTDLNGGAATPAREGTTRLTPSSSRRGSFGASGKEQTLGQVRPNEFFDATFKIMHIIPNPRGAAFELYVTDGTSPPANSFAPRNFHNVTAGLPLRTIFCLAIKDLPPEDILPYFQIGKVLKMNNVRSKVYKGEMELIWSELPTDDQLARGWKRRRCTLVGEGDERGVVIERRIQALKRGEDLPPELVPPEPTHEYPDPTTPSIATPIVHPPNGGLGLGQAPALSIRLATHLSTIHTDPLSHPVNTIAQILQNSTIPNKYRLRARVKSIHSRNLFCKNSYKEKDKDKDKEGAEESLTLIQSYCQHCRRAFKDTWCKSCNDTTGAEAEWRYRFVVVLEDGDGKGKEGASDELMAIIADDEAVEFLPPLPPYSTSTNPNDLKKTAERKKQCSHQVRNILLGAPMDGQRDRPLIDFTLEVYEVRKPGSGPKGKVKVGNSELGAGVGEGQAQGQREEEDDRVVVARVFGMKGL